MDGVSLRSLAKKSGELELSLVTVPTPEPAANEVVVRVEAAPINPSDLGVIFAGADLHTAQQSGTKDRPVITAKLSEGTLRAIAARLDQAVPCGNEGAGVVVAAGDDVKGFVGKKVAVLGGGMYGQFRTVRVDQLLVLPENVTPAEGASAFVNPLTALGMTETLRREGHKALVHTAAASQLGQMLVRLCMADGIPLVNIVRKPEQEALLRGIGAEHVVSSASPKFAEELTDAVATTGATLAFDATGGGTMADQILSAMERALNRSAKEYSRYGSTTHKQVYLYGGLDTAPTELRRSYGMAWGVGGWLVFPFMQKIGAEAANGLKRRVAAEIRTTFATSYSRQISLAEMLSLEAIAVYGQRATGEKFLVTPHR